MTTPFDGDGRVDELALRAHVEWLVASGADGLMPCGTTGEGALLDEDEVAGLAAATVAAVRGRARVLAHVGRPATEPTVRLARRLLAGGADGVSAVVPYYYAYDAEQLARHYGALLDGSGASMATRLAVFEAEQDRAAGQARTEAE